MTTDSSSPDRGDPADRAAAADRRADRAAAARRIQHQARWVDLQVQRAMERGDFDDLPGYGKPIHDLGDQHDPDWWVKRLVERERVSVLPPALALRTEDAGLDDRLDTLASEREARHELEDFNRRVRAARIQPLGGPPMVTPERDVEAALAAWRERRDARRRAATARAAARAEDVGRRDRLGWLRRRLHRGA